MTHDDIWNNFYMRIFCCGLVNLGEGDAQANFDDSFKLYVNKIGTFSIIVCFNYEAVFSLELVT